MTCGILNPKSAQQAALEQVAVCIGTSDFGEFGKLEQWNLLQPIPGYPRLIVGSTYARKTLEEALSPDIRPEPLCRTAVHQHEDRSAVESPEVRP